MSRWPKDNQSALIAFYGDPGSKASANNLVQVVPPFAMFYEGKRVKYLSFHKLAAPALKRALDTIWEYYGKNQATLDKLGVSKFAGTYNPRKIRGSSTKWSNHAYGAAIDFNAEQNGFGAGQGNIPKPVIAAFKAEGARWGGDYKGRTDPMHFEFCDGGETVRDFEGWLRFYKQPLPAAKPMGFAAIEPTDDPVPETAVVPVAAPAAEQEQQIQDSAERDAEPRGSWIARKWKGLTGWFSGVGGVGVLGYMTDPLVIVAIIGSLLVVAILFIWWMGPREVRAWIRKQVT